MTFPNTDALRKNLDSFYIRNDDRIARLGMTIDTFKNIPGLVGFWSMSSVQRSTGNVYDLSSQGRTLTYNGNPTYNIYNDLVPYIDLDGTGDFLSRADETDLDILGTETIYNSSVRGLTYGCWFRPDQVGVAKGLMSKASGAATISYYMIYEADGTVTFSISDTGAIGSINSVRSTNAASADNWYFVISRYVPSTTVDIFLSNTKTTLAAGIFAAIYNSNSPFEIGRVFTANDFGGHVSFAFISANALSDAYINGLFQQSRVLFGV